MPTITISQALKEDLEALAEMEGLDSGQRLAVEILAGEVARRKAGLLPPIVVAEGKVVDGYNRLEAARACLTGSPTLPGLKELGVPNLVPSLQGRSKDDLVKYGKVRYHIVRTRFVPLGPPGLPTRIEEGKNYCCLARQILEGDDTPLERGYYLRGTCEDGRSRSRTFGVDYLWVAQALWEEQEQGLLK